MNSTIISNTNPYPFNKPYYHYHKQPQFQTQITAAFAHSIATGNNEILKLNNCKVARVLNNKHSIQKIFSLYWDDFYDKFKHRIKRDAIAQNVNKMIGCKDFANGYLFYECPNCDNFHLTGFTCKSRFCPTCGKKYADARSTAIAEKCINIPHRHMVFTIPFELSDYFQRNRELIDALFKSVDDTFKYITFKMGRRKEYRFGFISTLHTFGRTLNFIPHLHVLVAEGVYDKDNNFKKASYFNYELLRKTYPLMPT